MTPTTRPWLPLAAVTVTLVLWASAFVAIRHLGPDFTPGALSLGRLLIGAICLGVVALTQPRMPRPTPREWVSIVTIGVLWFGVYNVSLNLGERFTTYLVIGLALAFAGVALIGTADSSSGNIEVVGVVLCLVSAAVYSISVILQKPLVARLPALHITWLACTVGMVACLPFAGQLVDDTRNASGSSILWVIYLGVFPTAIAFTTYAYALRHMSASSLGVTTYLVPPITIVMGVVFLGEAPPALAYVGGALALIGVAVARRKPRPKAAVPQAEEATRVHG